jgi:hypothetical protein
MNPVREALYAALAGDAQLNNLTTGIHHQTAPQNAATPYIVFNKQAGTPDWAFQGDPIQSDVWQVKAIDRGPSASTAEDIAIRIDTVLTDAALNVDDHAHLYLRRESDIDYPEQDGAETYHHVGALYRLLTE